MMIDGKSLFLAKVEYVVTPYMGNSYDGQRLMNVWAEDEDDAERIIRNHFEEKSDLYGTSYMVVNTEISEALYEA